MTTRMIDGREILVTEKQASAYDDWKSAVSELDALPVHSMSTIDAVALREKRDAAFVRFVDMCDDSSLRECCGYCVPSSLCIDVQAANRR